MQTKKFQRKVEDFTCEHCGTFVNGDGYTNHCPECLWSKHVDIHPGDRQNGCKGLMKPIHVFFQKQQWRLIHQCQKCDQKMIIKLKKIDPKKLSKILEVEHDQQNQ